MALNCYQYKVFTNRTGKKRLEAAFRNLQDARQFVRSIRSIGVSYWIDAKRYHYDGSNFRLTIRGTNK